MSEQERRDCIADSDGPTEIVEVDQTGPAPAWQASNAYSLTGTIGHDSDLVSAVNLTLGQAYGRLGELIQMVEDQAEPFDLRILDPYGNLWHHAWTKDGQPHPWSPLRQGNAPMPARRES